MFRMYANRILFQNTGGGTYVSADNTVALRENKWSNINMEVAGSYVRFILAGYLLQDWTLVSSIISAISNKTFDGVTLNGFDAQYIVRDFSISNAALAYPPVKIPANNGAVHDSSYTVSSAPYGIACLMKNWTQFHLGTTCHRDARTIHKSKSYCIPRVPRKCP